MFQPIKTTRKYGPPIIHGKRWYFRLVKQVNNKTRALLDDFSLNQLSERLVVCFTPDRQIWQSINRNKTADQFDVSNPIRLFAMFESYIEFFSYMSFFQEQQQTFYEIIFGEFPQKPHFDMDVSQSECESKYPGTTIDEICKTLMSALIRGIEETFTELSLPLNLAKDLLIYRSHGDNKRSFHLVINNYCHDGNKEAKVFYDAVVSKVKILTQDKYSEFIDKSVYGPRQNFRIVGSSKLGKNRPKVFCPKFDYNGKNYVHEYKEEIDGSNLLALTILQESLVGFTAGCRFIPPLIEPTQFQYSSDACPTLTGEIVETCLSLLKQKMSMCRIKIMNRQGNLIEITPNCPFSVKEVRSPFILLKRNAPSHCPSCQKLEPHEHEHPYLFINNGRVYWDCRRHPQNKRLLVGYLTLSEDDTSISELNNAEEIENSPELDGEGDGDGEPGFMQGFCFGDFKFPTDPQEIKSQETKSQETKSQETKSQETKSQEAKSQEIKSQEVNTNGVGLDLPTDQKFSIPKPEYRSQSVVEDMRKMTSEMIQKKSTENKLDKIIEFGILRNLSDQMDWPVKSNI